MTITAAIYARHSTDKQAGSTQDQIARCKAFCEQSGYEVTEVYCDEGISGSSIKNRPGIHGLIEGAIRGCFNRVIAEDLSRFSRDQGDICYLYKRMRYLDIEVETVTEGVVNELHIGLKGTMNALYLRDLSDKTHRGIIASVLKGRVPGGNAYGYDIVHKLDARGEIIKGLRKINEHEAKIVRLIFGEYERGMALSDICATLNRQGIPSPRGSKWRTAALIGWSAARTGILRQTLYKGEVTFNRTLFRKNPETGKRAVSVRPEKEWVRVPIPELAIMDAADFDRVQALIEKRSNIRHQKKLLNDVLRADEKSAHKVAYERTRRAGIKRSREHATYLVTSKLRCSRHQVMMIASRKKLYSCPEKPCPNRNLRLDRDLMPPVLEALATLLVRRRLASKDLMPPVLEALATFRNRDIQSWTDSRSQESNRLRGEVATLDAALTNAREGVNNVLNALARQRQTTETVTWLKEREQEIRRLGYDLSEKKSRLRLVSGLSSTETETVLGGFREALEPLRIAAETGEFDQETTLRLRRWIQTFTIIPEWNDGTETWERQVDVGYDWPQLLSDLLPR